MSKGCLQASTGNRYPQGMEQNRNESSADSVSSTITPVSRDVEE